MISLVTLEISIRVTMPVEGVDDPDIAMDEAEQHVQMAGNGIIRELKDHGVDDVSWVLVEALECEDAA